MITTVEELISVLKKCPCYAEVRLCVNGIDYDISHISLQPTDEEVVVWIDGFNS